MQIVMLVVFHDSVMGKMGIVINGKLWQVADNLFVV